LVHVGNDTNDVLATPYIRWQKVPHTAGRVRVHRGFRAVIFDANVLDAFMAFDALEIKFSEE
jgi:hypothetical protein